MNALLQCDETERALLGGLMIWPAEGAERWRELESDGLTPEDFRLPALGAVAAACSSLVSRGQPLTPSAVLDTMSPAGREMIGDALGLAKLHGAATPVALRAHAEIVMRVAQRRRIRQWHLEQAEAMAIDDSTCEPDAWQAHLETGKAKMANFAAVGKASATVSSSAVLLEVHTELSQSAAGIQRGCSTGFPALDLKYRPRGGHLVVKVGRPKMGKTSLALGLTRNALFERDSPSHAWRNRPDAIPVLWACDEMRNADLMLRMLADVSDLHHGALAQPSRDWLHDNTRRIRDASELIHASPLEFIEESECGRLERVFAAARTWRARQPIDKRTGAKGPAWLFLDYLQRMTMAGIDKHANNEQRVTAMCKAAKSLARELDITVFMLAQLNRDLEKREDKRPRSSDIRDSGSVEQEADVIMAVYRPIVYDPNAEQLRQRAQKLRRPQTAHEREELESIEAKLTDAEIIITDNRHGPKGTVYVDFDGSRYRFEPRVRAVE